MPWCVSYLLLQTNGENYSKTPFVFQFFMIYYHLIFSDNKKAVGYAWNLMGFVAKLAQGVSIPFPPSPEDTVLTRLKQPKLGLRMCDQANYFSNTIILSL